MTVLEKWDEPQPVRLRVDDFLRLDEAGAFDAYAKVELIGGVIVEMNAQYSTHARAKTILLRRIADAVDRAMPGFEAWSEVSVAIPPSDMPEPDIVVTSFRPVERAAVPIGTVTLIVEVADTTVAFDLGAKAGVYATAGVPEYWVVDLPGDRIHQHWAPADGVYGSTRIVPLGETITATTIAGLSIETGLS